MTPQQINIAVALCLGLKDPEFAYEIFYTDRESRTPFTDSLDACAEFERGLDEGDLVEYAGYIYQCSRHNHFDKDVAMITATPLQRCEAYLRLKGKWV